MKTYVEGDKFVDKLWVVFESTACRDAILEQSRKFIQCEGTIIRAKLDLVIEDRVQRNILFGIKFLLMSWGYPRNCIWVDIPLKQVSCGPDLIASVAIKDKILEVTFGTEWGSWELFTGGDVLKDLIELEKTSFQNQSKTKEKRKIRVRTVRKVRRG